jgi:hypothetical protein
LLGACHLLVFWRKGRDRYLSYSEKNMYLFPLDPEYSRYYPSLSELRASFSEFSEFSEFFRVGVQDFVRIGEFFKSAHDAHRRGGI